MAQRCKVCFLVALGCLASFLSAGEGTSASSFMKHGASTGASAMGGAGSALVGGPSPDLSEPAGLDRFQQASVSLSHLALPSDTTFDLGNLVLPLDGSALGLGLAWFNVPAFNSTFDPSAVSAYENDAVLTMVYSRGLPLGLDAGLALKILYSDLAGDSAWGAAADLGLLAAPEGSPWSLALTAINLGASSGAARGSEGLPMELRLGAGWSWKGSSSSDRLRLALDLAKAVDSRMAYLLGAELRPVGALALRAGYRFFEGGSDFAYALSDGSDLANFSAGLGLSVGPATLDYAFLPAGELGTSHRFSASWIFGAAPKLRAGPLVVQPKELLAAPPRFIARAGGLVFKPLANMAVTARIKEWKLEIRDQHGLVLKTLRGKGALPGQLVIKPDDLLVDGVFVPRHGVEGLEYSLATTDNKGVSKMVTQALDMASAKAEKHAGEEPFRARRGYETLVLSVPGLLSKGGNAAVRVPQAIEAEVEAVGGWRLEVRSGDRVVRTLTGAAPLPEALAWNGLDGHGKPVASAERCSFRLLVLDKAGKALPSGAGRWIRQPFDARDAAASVRARRMMGLWFRAGDAGMDSAAMTAAHQIAEAIRAAPAARVRVLGHASREGEADFNRQLALERAKAVRTYLVAEEGLPAEALDAASLGASQPFDSSGTQEGEALNRRVEVLLVEAPVGVGGRP